MAILEDDEVNEQEVKMEDYIKKIVENFTRANKRASRNSLYC